MMKQLVLSACVLSHFALASTDTPELLSKHEIVIAPSGGYASGSAGAFSVGARLGYHYSLSNAWQVGLTPSLEYFSIGPIWQTQVMASMTYNLFADKGIQNSPFVMAGAGFQARGGLESQTDVLWQATVGKRFDLFKGVTYRPSLSVSQVGSEKASIRLDFLSFSLTF